MMSKPVSRTLTKWAHINERIIEAWFKGRQAKLTVVACYAPTNDADDRTKKQFLHPKGCCQRCPQPWSRLLCWQFQFEVRSKKSYYFEVLSSQGLGEFSKNISLLIDLALTNYLSSVELFFNIKSSTNTHGNSPGGRTHNQIDHILINKKWMSRSGNQPFYPVNTILREFPPPYPDSAHLSLAQTLHMSCICWLRNATNGGKGMYLVFVDFKNVFDSVQWESLWKILRHYGIPDKLVSLVIAL